MTNPQQHSPEVIWENGTARLERLVVEGPFTINGEEMIIDNNVYLLGDDTEVLVIDASHDAAPIAEAAAGRRVRGIWVTHGHLDHINAAPALAEALSAPVALHPDDRMLWEQAHGAQKHGEHGETHAAPDAVLSDGQSIPVAGVELKVLHTPGHTPGSVCLYAPAEGWILTGDTLFPGGPGATGRPFSDFDTIIDSIETTLFALPEETAVYPGHGDGTTIGLEKPSLQEWKDRGY